MSWLSSKVRRSICVIAFVLAYWASAVAEADVVSWNVDSDGFWDEGGNWDAGTPPKLNDDVHINRPAGTFTITIRQTTSRVLLQSAENIKVVVGGNLQLKDGSSISGDLLFEDGRIDADGTLTLSGANSQWSGGILKGNPVINNGTLTLSGSAVKTIIGQMDNNGTVNHTGNGNLALQGGGAGTFVNNLANAIYDFRGDGT